MCVCVCVCKFLAFIAELKPCLNPALRRATERVREGERERREIEEGEREREEEGKGGRETHLVSAGLEFRQKGFKGLVWIS